MEQVDDTIHAIPLFDLMEHDCSVDCWCNPTEEEEFPGVYVHHALDGREDFESGKRLPS